MILRICLAALLGAGVLASAEPSTLRRLDGSAISIRDAEELARKTLDAEGVTGAQVAIIQDGRLYWKFAHGLRRKSPDLPMRTDTNTWAASITKSIFATYVVQLAERGELALDVPVAKQLTAPLQSFSPYKDSATTLVRDPQWQLVTPRHLLSHSSGFRNFASLEPDKKMRLHFKPGSAFHYSGEGLNLLQFLVEQKKGKTLDVLLDEAFFRPFGMTQTGLIYREEFAPNVADRFGEKGEFLAKTQRFPARGAGSMATSVEDLARFTEALLDEKIVPLARLLDPVLPIRTLHQFPRAANEPEGEEAKRVGLAYGLGWGLLTRTPHGPAFFKEGHGDGAQTYMICFAEKRSCMLLLTNSDNGERAFRPLLEGILGNTFTPWEWEGYLFAK
ncbi:MAG TPA: serine hydrolase domain-containing protein [Bryobacteraceae bacterium]|nr:serine hydrolase domain-containing protein [Bryobacteraceae bacterium]